MTSDIKFGIVLPVYLFNDERAEWARRSFASLARTERPSWTPRLVVVVKEGIRPVDDVFFSDEGCVPFLLDIVGQPENAKGGCGALAWGFDYTLARFSGVTHVLFVGDDFVYHPNWLREQEALIERHPNAVSTYVYRSNNTRWHRTIRVEGPDHLVTSISGPGCFSRAEWTDWRMDYRAFPHPSGYTLDILHSNMRPGERWVTGRSYIQQIGVRGMHNGAGECDEACEFVGEGEVVHV